MSRLKLNVSPSAVIFPTLKPTAQKLTLTAPRAMEVGRIKSKTGGGGNSSEFDSWDKHRE